MIQQNLLLCCGDVPLDHYGTLCIITHYGIQCFTDEGMPVWVDILRLFVAFGGVILIIAFWYWLMDSIGTF